MGLLDALMGEANSQQGGNAAGHIDASSIMSLVSHLAAGDEETTGAASGIINPSVLMSEIGKLTGMGGASQTNQMNQTNQINQPNQMNQPYQPAAKHAGLNGNMIMSLVSSLANGGERETGAQSGRVNPNLLTGILSAFTGNNGFNAGSIVNAIAPLLKNADFKGDFMKNPVKAIENVIGVNLPDEHLQPVINALKAKVSPQK